MTASVPGKIPVVGATHGVLVRRGVGPSSAAPASAERSSALQNQLRLRRAALVSGTATLGCARD